MYKLYINKRCNYGCIFLPYLLLVSLMINWKTYWIQHTMSKLKGTSLLNYSNILQKYRSLGFLHSSFL